MVQDYELVREIGERENRIQWDREWEGLKIEMNHEKSTGGKALLRDRINDKLETPGGRTSAACGAQTGPGSLRDEGMILQ